MKPTKLSAIALAAFILPATGYAAGITEPAAEPVIFAPAPVKDRGWHLLGVEGGLSYANISGDHILGLPGSPVFGAFDSSFTNVNVALVFASRDLTADQNRWLLSPFLSYAVSGEEDIANGRIASDNPGGDFKQYEVGVRVEQERYISDRWSWVWGGSVAYVEADNTVASNAGVAGRELSGYRAGLHIGANARIADSWVLTGRFGYSFLEIEEIGETAFSIAPDLQPDPREDTNRGRGYDLSIGLRYEF